MKNFKIFLASFVLNLLLSSTALAELDLESSYTQVKSALSGVQISQGPDLSTLTPPAWGPKLYRKFVEAVVLIYVPGVIEDLDPQGSGVVISSSGHILTNWHVVGDAKAVLVVFKPKPPKTLENLTKADLWVANVLDPYKHEDLALLEVDRSLTGSKELPSLAFVPFEYPDFIEVGQDVLAIGHSVGLFWNYSEGVVSQIRPRYRWESNGNKFMATVLQTHPAISYKSSGGPLINSRGNLVGIISWMKASQVTEEGGFNFAVSVQEFTDKVCND